MSETDDERGTERRDLWTAVPWEKIGAAAYVMWGLWHLQIVAGLWQMGAALEDPDIGVRLQQGAFHILFFVIVAVVVGAWLNWRNNTVGYWINLLTVGWTEVGLFFLFILPGLFPWLPTGWVGPVLWLAALTSSSLGFSLRSRQSSSSRLGAYAPFN